MAIDAIKNFVKANVSTGYNNTATSIVLASGTGAKFPNPATDGQFNLVWWDCVNYADPSDDPNVEVIRVTARSVDTLTIVRGQEGTAAANHNTAGVTYRVILPVTSKLIADLKEEAKLVGTKQVDETSIGNSKTLLYNSSTGKLEYVDITAHNHDTIYYTKTALDAFFEGNTAGGKKQVAWASLTGVPATFTPTAHNHDAYYYTETEADAKFALIHSHPYRADTWVPTWGDVTGKPSTFAPSAHTLDSHSNVTISANTDGEILRWNGTAWVNNTLAEANISAIHSHPYRADSWVPSWADIASKPTTVSGFGITDAMTTAHAANAITGFGGNGSATTISRSDHSHSYLSTSTGSTQNGYFGNIYLRDDTNSSHYLCITNANDLTALRTLSLVTGDADRTVTISADVTLAHDTHDNTQAAHTWFTKAAIEGLLTGAITTHTHAYRADTWVPAWTDVTGKPSVFAPDAHTLDGHSNVTITTIGSGHILQWNGTAWVNRDLATAGISATHLHPYRLDSWLPTWNDVQSKPATFAPSAHQLDSHSNVTITSIAAGEILKWSGTAWINNTLAEAGISATHSHPYRADTWVPTWTDVQSKPSTFAPSAHSLDSHSNVTVTSIASGHVLQWSGSAWVNRDLATAGISATHSHPYRPDSWLPAWTDVTGKPSVFAPDAHSLDSHSNVTITTNSNGEILMWNGTAWINRTLAEASISAVGHGHAWSEISSKPSSTTTDIDDAVTKRHSQNTDTGTSSATFQIGGGVKLKNSSGVLEIRNAADSAWADIVCNSITVKTTTTIESETVTFSDNTLVLNNNYTGSAPTENGGLEVERGTLTNASLLWDETNDRWMCGLAGSEGYIYTSLTAPATATRWPTWDEVTSKPSTYTPAAHAHAWADITSGVPASFPPSAHQLDAHSNVAITSVASGEILKWNGSQWVNNTLSEAGIAPSSHVGATGTAHGAATTSVNGFMSSADKTKLDGIATSANNYSHPTGDGNLHVPATGTTNNTKVLKAGSTAGSISWAAVDWSELSNKPGTFAPSSHALNSHSSCTLAQLSAIISDATLVSSTGTNATGTWGINISGSAASLTTARNINGISFDGSADITVPTIYDTGFTSIINPGGAIYTNQTSTVTGALAITLPVGMVNTMLRMTIQIYEYATNESFTVFCGGYTYGTGNTWANSPFAYIIGNPGTNRQFTVRFGYTAGGKAVIYIGETNSTWSYPQVFVTDVQLGYSGQSASYRSGWTAGAVTAFENVTATVSSSQIGYQATANTANSVVLRDGSGNFSAGTITATLSGTASNATTAGGLAVHTGTNNEANKIVRTDGNGYIQAGWINTTSGDNGTTAITRVYASSDGYIRYYSLANFAAQILVTGSAKNSHTHIWADITDKPSTFTPPIATASTLGGVKQGSNVTIDAAGVISVAAPYAHPTGDGNLHVPATGTTNNTKVLKAGATAGTMSWAAVGWSELSGKPSTFTPPVATASVLGGVKQGTNISIDANGVISATYSYTHPSSDGNLHVPATGTTNNTKVLKAGATAGSLSWGQIAWGEITGVPTTFTPSSHTLNGHTGVLVSGELTGDLFAYDGSNWVNLPKSELGIMSTSHAANSITGFGGTGTATTVSRSDHSHASYLTGNQTITLSGDVSGSGQTAISVAVNNVKGAAIPTLATGYLKYTGSAWSFVNETYMQTSHAANAITGFGGNGSATTISRSDHSHASYLTGNQTITLSGDVSGSGTTGITTTIGANKVTLAMMAQMATASFLGRNTASTGNVEVISVATAKTMLGLGSAAYTASTAYRSSSWVPAWTDITDKPSTFTPAAHTHTLRLPHTWAIPGEVKVPSGDTDFIVPFFVPVISGATVRIASVRYKINSGTSVTCKVQKNGVDATGLTGLSATTTAATTDPADITLADGDQLALVVTAVSGTPKNLTFTIFVEYVIG